MAESYWHQKLGEAVSTLSCGRGTLQERLQDAKIPLGTLQSLGRHGKATDEREGQLTSIMERLMNGASVVTLNDDEAYELARDITDLHSGLFYDAVWALEDQVQKQNAR